MPLLATLRGLHVVCPGETPAELGSLSNLVALDLNGNDLSGCVPSSLEDPLTGSSLIKWTLLADDTDLGGKVRAAISATTLEDKMPNELAQSWEGLVARMEELWDSLLATEILVRDHRGRFPKMPKQGIYCFYGGDEPIYVGRTNRMRSRVLEHGRVSARHNSATLAYLIALRGAQAQEFMSVGAFNRDDLQFIPEFKELFDEAKQLVRQMSVRVVEVTDPIEQTLFEVYVALKLKTPWNSFEKH